MAWVLIALVTALSTATGDALLKGKFSHVPSTRMAVVRATSPVPFLLPVFLLLPWPATDPVFWRTVMMLVPLEILALLLYMEAIRTSPLSLTIPFLAFTPAFIILTGWAILGERVSGRGLAGIVCIVAGAYLLNLKASRRGLLEPIRAIARERGSRLMLVVAALYSLTSVLGKRAVEHSNPFFFAAFYFMVLGAATPVALTATAWLRGRPRPPLRPGRGLGWSWWAVGLCQAIMVLSHMWAISLAPAAYMIAVKRTSLLFSVIYGHVLFRELDVANRLAGAALMLTGVALVAFA